MPSMKLLTSVTPALVSAMPLVSSSTLVFIPSASVTSVSFFARSAITLSVSRWTKRVKGGGGREEEEEGEEREGEEKEGTRRGEDDEKKLSMGHLSVGLQLGGPGLLPLLQPGHLHLLPGEGHQHPLRGEERVRHNQ